MYTFKVKDCEFCFCDKDIPKTCFIPRLIEINKDTTHFTLHYVPLNHMKIIYNYLVNKEPLTEDYIEAGLF